MHLALQQMDLLFAKGSNCTQWKGGCQEASLKERKQGAKAEVCRITNENVLWSDEPTFDTFGSNQYLYVSTAQSFVKHGGGLVMASAAF